MRERQRVIGRLILALTVLGVVAVGLVGCNTSPCPEGQHQQVSSYSHVWHKYGKGPGHYQTVPHYTCVVNR